MVLHGTVWPQNITLLLWTIPIPPENTSPSVFYFRGPLLHPNQGENIQLADIEKVELIYSNKGNNTRHYKSHHCVMLIRIILNHGHTTCISLPRDGIYYKFLDAATFEEVRWLIVAYSARCLYPTFLSLSCLMQRPILFEN